MDPLYTSARDPRLASSTLMKQEAELVLRGAEGRPAGCLAACLAGCLVQAAGLEPSGLFPPWTQARRG